jgi:hypothetical protein
MPVTGHEAAPVLCVRCPTHPVHGAPAGYAVRPAYRGLGGYNIDTVTTKQGTVTIDVVDAASQSIVWQGVGEGVVPQKAERNTSATVNTAVTEIFRGFPASKAL